MTMAAEVIVSDVDRGQRWKKSGNNEIAYNSIRFRNMTHDIGISVCIGAGGSMADW